MVKKVAYDAGHGYNTSGKRTPAGEREWMFNDKVADAFHKEMSTYSGVSLKRLDDSTGKTDVSLSARTNGANAWGADVFISFHHNALAGKWGNHTGVEIHVYKSRPSGSTKLAKLVQPKLVKAYGLKDRGIKYTDLHITRETNCDAILIEGGFMDSNIDIKKLRDKNVLAKAGKEVATAVAQYLGLKKKPVVIKKPTTAVKSAAKLHKVVAGDTLWGISSKYGVSVSNIKNYNNLKSDVIHVGDVIYLEKTHKVRSGDTLWGLSREYGLTVSELKSINDLKSDTIAVGQVLVVKK